jgi:hypothetical protein
MRGLVARALAVIRIDAVWPSVEAIDMRAGTETALARVVRVFGEAYDSAGNAGVSVCRPNDQRPA